MEQKEVPPPSNAKQIKHLKKKLGKLNKKVRHSKKKHNNLVSKRNSKKEKTEELKGPHEPKGSREPESWIPTELEQAFGKDYRSYRINRRSRMDLDTFSDQIRQNLIDLISRELTDLNSARVQTTTWIRFRIEHEEGIIDRVRLPFNSRMMDIFQGSDMSAPIEEMFTHMKTQKENPELANSRFIFDEVLFMDINFYQLNLTRGSSYLSPPDWVANKGTVINPKNEKDEECFKWSVIAALHYGQIRSHPERISNLTRLKIIKIGMDKSFLYLSKKLASF